MNKTTLEKLFHGDIVPSEEICRRSEEEKVLVADFLKLEDAFCADMSRERRDEYEAMLDVYAQIDERKSVRAFIEGYRLATWTLMDALRCER